MKIGIVGYGAYIPCYRITTEAIAAENGHDMKKISASLNAYEKAVPAKDEDSITIGVRAAQNAILRAGIDAANLGAIYVGSESHPYIVKPSATIIGAVLGSEPFYSAADIEFACKGGTAALQLCISMVGAGMTCYAMGLGTDTAQAHQRDILEYTTGAGGAAFIVGNNADELLAVIENTFSLCSETPDFWRRGLQRFPEHVGRFTAEPGYFSHIENATREMLRKTGTKPSDFDHVIFHQPNGRFPAAMAHKLGFLPAQTELGFLVKRIGNSYSANSLLGLTAVLDAGLPGDSILLVSYGSGSGCDAFVFTVTARCLERRDVATKTEHYISRKRYVSYQAYRRNCEFI